MMADAGVPPIRFQAPEIPDLQDIARYFEASARARWFSNGGPCHVELVQRLETYVGGGARCVPVANATLGLMVALRALQRERAHGRPLVLLPSFTFAATVDAVLWCGLTPVFVDVAPGHWHLCPDALDAALEQRPEQVAVVLACSTFGTAPPTAVTDRWTAACRRHGASLLVDTAAGFGSLDDHGNPLGRQGDAEVFSFHATKPFAIGEGGAVFTADAVLRDRMVSLCNFGFGPTREVDEDAGINAKLPEIAAATALAVLDRYDGILSARRGSARRMREQLASHGFEFQQGGDRSTFQFVPTLAPDAATRDRVLRLAADRQIELRTYFSPPLHLMRAFRDIERADALATTDDLSRRTLSLPMANDLDHDAQERIVEALRAATG
jgi:dTDP-4-amino-4,6-dideoxygalactose transaminase